MVPTEGNPLVLEILEGLGSFVELETVLQELSEKEAHAEHGAAARTLANLGVSAETVEDRLDRLRR
jgi:adenylate cyclase class IV